MSIVPYGWGYDSGCYGGWGGWGSYYPSYYGGHYGGYGTWGGYGTYGGYGWPTSRRDRRHLRKAGVYPYAW